MQLFTKNWKAENSEFFREKSKNKQIHQKLKTLNFSGKSPKINNSSKTKNSEFFWEKSKNKQIHQKLKSKSLNFSGKSPKINKFTKK